MKTCKKCRKEHPLEDFLPCSLRKDGRANICSECRNASKLRKVTSGMTARKMLKTLKTEQKKRPLTPKQQKRKEAEALYQKVRAKMLDDMFAKYGFYFDQITGETISDRSMCETHHILYRSQCFDIELLHSEKNLIIILKATHNWLHKNPKENDKLAYERGLKKQE